MKSMTGYAEIEQETACGHFTIELHGYNSRYLDVAASLPSALLPFEGEIRALAASYCKRGKVEVAICVKDKTGAHLVINKPALDTYLKLFAEIIGHASENVMVNKEIRPLDLLRCEGVLVSERNTAANALWEQARPLLEAAFERLNHEREREGAHTQANIAALVTEIEDALAKIIECVPEAENLIKTNIQKRLAELSCDNIDGNRILTETAFLLMKCTIAEEISRLESHLAEFRAQAQRDVSLGKKLDFLCQEISREINTIGSKTPLFAINALVVSMKEYVENIREQLRNIE